MKNTNEYEAIRDKVRVKVSHDISKTMEEKQSERIILADFNITTV